jgi:hypothetical protein
MHHPLIRHHPLIKGCLQVVMQWIRGDAIINFLSHINCTYIEVRVVSHSFVLIIALRMYNTCTVLGPL